MGDAELYTTSICAHELLAGRKSQKQLFIIQELLKQMIVLSHDSESATLSAMISRTLEEKGAMISSFDILIAAICMRHNSTLITFDQDFARVSGLKKVLLK